MNPDINTIIEMYCKGEIKAVLDAARENPAFLKGRNEYDVSLLDQAAYNGDKETVSALLAMGAPADIDDPKYCTPLISAIQSSSAGLAQKTEIVKLLIQHGADVNTKSNDGDSALHAAVWKELPEIAELLLKNGADVNILGHEDDDTPLCVAARYDKEELVRLLLRYGANPWMRHWIVGTPLDAARWSQTKSGGYQNVIKLLEECMDRQADEAIAHNDFTNPDLSPNLINLYVHGRTREVMDVLRADHSLVNRHQWGGAVLYSAAYRGHKDIVAELLALGANADTDDPQYAPPLVAAIASGSEHALEIAQLLIEHGANVNTRFHSDDSPIFKALMYGLGEKIKFLLNNGADLNILTPANKQHILGSAAAWGDEEMVRFALELGADPRLEYNALGTTPIGVAREYASEKDSQSHRNIVKILEEWIDQSKFKEQAEKKE